MLPVSVLFTQKNTIYKQLNVDCWDEVRDARNYKGDNAIIAHPPCRSWGRLSHFSKHPSDEPGLALYAISIIKKNGGVLEHPYGSRLFPTYLPYPGNYDAYGGFTVSIDQFWFGHKAIKKSFIYICGTTLNKLPALPLRFDAVEHVVNSSSRHKYRNIKEISKNERSATPINLALWLIEVALLCKKK